MKKVFMGMFAMATMLLATSCSEDELIAQSSGNEVTVSFTANVRSDVKTKAVGDDTDGIDQLIFAVYDENGDHLSALDQTITSFTEAENGKKKATINVTLVKGQTYSFAFWAQDAYYAAYSFNPATKLVSVNYGQTANNKNADAFFANETLTVSGSFEKDITLKRPFAQVNFLTTGQDILDARKAGFDPKTSSIVVKNAATSLNVLDGTVTGSTEATFNLADILLSENTKIKNGTQYVGFDATTKEFPSKDTESEANEFYYLATAYFLTGAASTTIDASMNVVAEDNGKMDLSVSGVNAQRNFRTNIYGNLLTSGGKFNVTVDPGFDGDYSDKYEDPTTKVVGTIAEAQALFDNTSNPVTNVTITEAPTSEATLTLPDTQEEVTINFAFEEGSTPAKITIEGGSNSNANEMTVNGDAGELVINAPQSTVTLNGEYTSVIATTAENTLIVPKGVTIGTLTLKAGNAEIYYGAVALENIVKDANYDGKITWLLDSEASVEDIQNAIENGDAIKLIEDLTVESIILINKTFTIDLNGCTIIGTDNTEKNFSILDNRSNLTIKNTNTSNGKLTLTATINRGWGSYSAVVANNPGGNLTVESGVIIEHLGGTDMAYGIDNLTNGKGTSAITTINGATVKSPYTAIRQFLNGVEATNNLIVNANSIISGTKRGIWMQDPSKNANTGSLTVQENANVNNVHLSVTNESTEWPIELSVAASSLGEKGITLGEYIPAGYEVVEADGVYSIKRWIIVSTADELIEALEAGENDVMFAKNIKIDPANMSNAYGKTGINVKSGQSIDGDGYILDIKGAGGTWDSGICARGGLIKDLTVTGSFRGIFIREGNEPLILKNVILKDVTYTISIDEANNQTVEAYDSKFYGWTSYAKTIGSAKFTDCTFGEGNGYAFCRPYAPTEFINCNFEAGFKVDPVAAVSFENCTLDGVAITAENLATLVTSTNNATVK